MPFGDKCQYKTFSDCTKAHSDKDNPQAYCATIQDKTEAHCKRRENMRARTYALRVQGVRQSIDETYEWDADKKQYLREGVAVSLATLLTIRDQLTDAQFDDSDDLADNLEESGDLEQWQDDMRDLVAQTHTAAYMLGRGGINVMDTVARGAVAGIIGSQFNYLSQFALDVKNGTQSVAQAKSRSHQYLTVASYSFAVCQRDAYGDILELPAMPCDGNTACLSNCRCAWDIEEDETEFRAYWLATGDDNECSDCDDRATSYSPYTQKKERAAAA